MDRRQAALCRTHTQERENHSSGTMEPVAAACAMQWCIELDAGLRSRKPGSQLEAIMKLGSRLQQWSKEPPVSASVASLFHLSRGQEQAFANAIMMHLTQTFMTADNPTRLCIAKIFLQEMKMRKKANNKNVWKRGLFTKERFPNYMEILNRIKSVACSGDHFARALAFWVVGCVAELAADSCDFCRLILEALHSQHEHEVQAALFAVSCFCNISGYFATLAVGYICDLIIAKERTSKTRLQAISVVGQMTSSVVAALKAHEMTKGLIVSMPVEEVVATIKALSTLALECSVLLAAQVDLLLFYVRSDPRSTVHKVSLKCLIKITIKAAGKIGSEETLFGAFILICEGADEPQYLRDMALQALRKLFPFCVLVLDAGYLIRLLPLVLSKAHSSVWSEGQSVLGFLVDIVRSLQKVRPDLLTIADKHSSPDHMPLATASEGNKKPLFCSGLPTFVVSLVCDQIARLGYESGIEGSANGGPGGISKDRGMLCGFELRRRCRFLGCLLVRLARHSSDCAFVIVDRLSKLLENFIEDIQHVEKAECQHMVGQKGLAEIQNLHSVDIHAESAVRSCILKMMCCCIGDCSLFWLSEEGPSNSVFVRMTSSNILKF